MHILDVSVDYLWKSVPECRVYVCASTAIRIPDTFALSAYLSIPPLEQIPEQERGEMIVSFGAMLACGPQEHNTKTDSTKERK